MVAGFPASPAGNADLLIEEARDRQRKRRLLVAVVVAIVVAVALVVDFNRGSFGLGASSHGSFAAGVSAAWRPTEDRFPYRVRKWDAEDFYALRAVPAGPSLFRYVDAAGWSIVYPRRFRTLAYSLDTGPITGGSRHLQGASFANYPPVPAPSLMGNPWRGRRLPARGVLFQLTITIDSGLFTRIVKTPQAHSPISLANSIRTGGADRSAQSGSLSFKADGHIYQASFWAGQHATSSDLRALARLISSVRFAPLKPGTSLGPLLYLEGEPVSPPGP
jgi:hypothetical protein